MPNVPSTIGRYTIVEMVGRGGMGVLYRARDPILERDVALKVLHDLTMDRPTRERLAREAKAVAHMQHRNIVTIHEFGEAEGQPYIAMEFLPGNDLEAMIRQQQPKALIDKIGIAIQLCDGLGYAHDRGLVHRDIKPGNVRVLEDGTLKILDFGIAKFARNTMTESGSITGTPSYMAPEQISGKPIDGRADLFSAGALLYELCSGRRPFEGASMIQIIYQILHSTPPPLRQAAPDVPEALERIVAKALERDPAKRYERASEMAADLRKLRNSLGYDGGVLPQDSTPVNIGPVLLRSDMETPAPISFFDRATSGSLKLPGTNLEVRWRLVWSVAALVLAIGGSAYLFRDRLFQRPDGTAPYVRADVTPVPAKDPLPTPPPAPEPTFEQQMVSMLAKVTDAFAVTEYRKAIELCDLVLAALSVGGRGEHPDLLARVYELRARARLATGDRAGAQADFAELVKVRPDWLLDPSTSSSAQALFKRAAGLLKAPAAKVVEPDPAPSVVVAPPPPPPPPTGLAVGTGSASATIPAGLNSASLGALAPPPPPAPAPAPVQRPIPTGPYLVGSVQVPTAPVRTIYVPAVYSNEAQAARVAGTVQVELLIGADGKVKSVKRMNSIPLLDAAAVEAAKQWEYIPARVEGYAVSCILRTGVEFVLK